MLFRSDTLSGIIGSPVGELRYVGGGTQYAGPVTQGHARVEVKSEPLIYCRDARASYFKDLLISTPDGNERLARHRQEMDVIGKERDRSEEHTSELQSLRHLVYRLLPE